MQIFTFGLGPGGRILRLWGHNPLVRRSDRLEAVALCLATVIMLAAAPVLGAVATSVHDSRTQIYTDIAQQRTQVAATATAPGRSIGAGPGAVLFTAPSRWSFEERERTGVIDWDHLPKTGDQQSIWIDRQGDPAGPPPPLTRADSDAIAVGLGSWCLLGIHVLIAMIVVRRRLNRTRNDQWDRDIAALTAGGR